MSIIRSIFAIFLFLGIAATFVTYTLDLMDGEDGRTTKVAPQGLSVEASSEASRLTVPDLSPRFTVAPNSLTETLARPLFEPMRETPKPTPVRVAPPTPIEAPRLDAELLGTILQSSGSIAILMDGPTGQIVRLPEGEALNGWFLEEIGPGTARFSNSGTVHEMSLSTKESQ